MAEKPVIQTSRSDPDGRAGVVVCIITLVCTAGAWAWIASRIGMDRISYAVCFGCGAALVLAVLGSFSFGSSFMRILAVWIASPIVVCFLLLLETYLITVFLSSFPPARPMFHNKFGPGQETLLPSWRRPLPMADSAGNQCWSDFEDNCLVIVMAAERRAPTGELCGLGVDQARFRVARDEGDQYVTVARCTGRLIVISPKAAVAEFALPSGAAKAFAEQASAETVLRRVHAIIDRQETARFDDFVRSARLARP
ncbi:MAG: hypothetical protein HZB38_08155 [Planctomycetes bacterium]|nr:hypothetical protein [Planctomycetota bacterium]